MKYRCVMVNAFSSGHVRYSISIPVPFIRDTVELAKKDLGFIFRFIYHDGHVAAAMYMDTSEENKLSRNNQNVFKIGNNMLRIRIIHYEEFLSMGGYIERIMPGIFNSLRQYPEKEKKLVEMTFDEIFPFMREGSHEKRMDMETYTIKPII